MEPSFVPPLFWMLPFVVLLLAIAVLPVAAPQFWEPNLRKLGVSTILGLPILVLYLFRQPGQVGHAAQDYLSFIILLGSLYVISGGVLVHGNLRATPRVNTAFIALGTLLASFIGTTGASMLLIRPLLKTNAERRHVAHTVVFFIFLVSNIGGCLTPLGDPPLFLGYLQGVPFTWTLRLAPAWLVTGTLLLVIYYFWDARAYARETPIALKLDQTAITPAGVFGRANLILLGGIVLVTAVVSTPWREFVMVALAAVSFVQSTDERRANQFSLHPILEVAAIFVGIFITIIPALELLRARGYALGLQEPWEFFWATGLLSSLLDNAPTYLALLAVAQSQGLPAEVVGVPHRILLAISLGAVFMGANTYIGNGPNFMVRSIAESHGIRMPSFGGYMLYSGAVLLPLFVLVTLLFF
jgi:Na+/H+ antiporter NhaD/arsenite permease-like protein